MTPTTIKAGDNITFTDLIAPGGVPFVLTGCTVTFAIRSDRGGTPFTATATYDPDQTTNPGKVTYATNPSTFPKDIANYVQEWQIALPLSTGNFTFPEDGYNIVKIIDKL